ncbi:hypothetical protein [Spirosoma montaniterrae]|uniref:Uncharacterized protein n=1 Tax=Spirosoma montaniterrae TaxID=1178516 RepID=A0A1P9X404_9BACT|nr:hypothetical protein [Spirosoma montaniterrae]AQG82376.1 hypothetical protein AWR27_07490 [Spirosoma montaniterrae]
MKSLTQVIAFSLLLTALCSCREQGITPQELTPSTDLAVANSARSGPGGISNGPSLPLPTIIAQTYIPANDFWAHTRCRAWRITWPTYPVGTNPNLIPTVFTVKNGNLNSFNYLNNTSATNTFKANFNLYHNNKLETVSQLWEEITHVLNGGGNMAITYFTKSKYSAATVETWVKGRPSHFQTYWEQTIDTNTETPTYQQGEIYQFKLVDGDALTPDQFGGIRIVSMTPRILEVYLAEPND